MAADDTEGRKGEQRPGRGEGCVNGVFDLACCLSAALLTLAGAAGGGLVLRAALRRR